MSRTVSLLAIALAVTVGLGPSLQAARPRLTELPLTMTLRDTVSDGLRSDGTPYQHASDNVRAVLVANDFGNFVFDTNDNAALDGLRRLTLDFHGAGPFPSAITVDTFVGTIGDSGNAALDGNLRTMTVGSGTLSRRMNLSWVVGNLQYSLRWNGVAGATLVTFTCSVDDGAGACQQWTAESNAAGLYSIPTKGKATETYLGTFAMPFAATLDRQEA